MSIPSNKVISLHLHKAEKSKHKILLDDYKVRPELNKHKNI